MSKRLNGTYAGTFPYSNAGGIHGGGYCGGMSTIADDGTLGVSTDCAGIGGFREGNATEFKQLLRYGDNIPASESVFKGGAQWFYGIDLCASQPTVRATTRHGRLYRTLNGGQAGEQWTRVTGFNGGNYDAQLSWRNAAADTQDNEARFHGEYLRIDPTNPDIVYVGHPDNGASKSSNFLTAANFALVAGLPTPLNTGSERYGVQFAFDRSSYNGVKCLRIFAFVSGRGIYKTEDGGDTWTQISNTITKIRDMQAVGGRLYVTDFTTIIDFNGLIRWYDGGTWFAASTSFPATTIAVKPDNKLYAAALRTGGQIHLTTDGSTWNTTDLAFSMNAPRDPWLGTANTGFLAPGTLRWEVRSGVNRWWVSTGVGVAYFDNPPRTSLAQKWTHAAHGIQQLILMNGGFADDGTFHVTGQDKAYWRFLPGKLDVEPTQVWDNTAPLVQANDVAVSPSGSGLVVFTAKQGAGSAPIAGLWKSTQGGAPKTFSQLASVGTTAQSGNVAISTDLNWVWAPTGGEPVRYTLDGGATPPINSVFRNTVGGTPIDMTGARIHNTYTDRRKILVSIEGQTGHFLLYCVGSPNHDGSTLDLATKGLYKSTDGGANFIRVRTTRFSGDTNQDHYSGHIVPVPGQPNHFFWAPGAVEGPINANGGRDAATSNVFFSTDQLVTTTALPGFREPESITVGAKMTASQLYGTLYVSGWRQVASVWTYGIWASTNFDPANLAAATWTLDEDFPCGRDDFDRRLYADPKNPGRLIVLLPAGGYAVKEYNFAARAV